MSECKGCGRQWPQARRVVCDPACDVRYLVRIGPAAWTLREARRAEAAGVVPVRVVAWWPHA